MAKGDSLLYVPKPLGEAQDLRELITRLEEEFRSIQTAMGQVESLPERNVAISKPRDGMLVYADGTNWDPGFGEGVYARIASAWIALATLGALRSIQVITATGTYTKPANLKFALICAIGAGSSGGSSVSAVNGGGGGQGEIAFKLMSGSDISATVSVTIGAGGAAIPANTNSGGNPGGTTSFGAYLTATGGIAPPQGNFGGAGGAGGLGGTGANWSIRGAPGTPGGTIDGASYGLYSTGGGVGGGSFAVAGQYGGGGGGGSTTAASGAGGYGRVFVFEFF